MTAAQAVTLIVRDLYNLTTIENELTRDPHLASNNTKRRAGRPRPSTASWLTERREIVVSGSWQ